MGENYTNCPNWFGLANGCFSLEPSAGRTETRSLSLIGARRWQVLTGILLILTLTLVAGCGKSEGIVSGLTGGAVEVDADKQTLTFTDEDGTQVDGGLGWIGLFYFDGDIRAAAESYQQELEAMGLEVGTFVIDEEGEYSNLMGVSGYIGGQYYAGMLAFAQEDGRNVVSVTFGESEEGAD